MRYRHFFIACHYLLSPNPELFGSVIVCNELSLALLTMDSGLHFSVL